PARSASEGLRTRPAEVLVLAVGFPETTNTEGVRLRRLRHRSFETHTCKSIRGKITDMKLEMLSLVLRLDCLSCVLTIFSTILVGRRCWEGWVLAAAN